MSIFTFLKFIALIMLTLCLVLGLNFNLDLIDLKFGYCLDKLPSWFSFFASNNFILVLFFIILISVIEDLFPVKSITLNALASALSVMLLTVVMLKVLDPSFIDILITEAKLCDNRKALWVQVYNSEILKLYDSSKLSLLDEFNIFRDNKSKEIVTFLGDGFFRDISLNQIRESAIKSAKEDLVHFLDYVRGLEVKVTSKFEMPIGLIIGAVAIIGFVAGAAITYYYTEQQIQLNNLKVDIEKLNELFNSLTSLLSTKTELTSGQIEAIQAEIIKLRALSYVGGKTAEFLQSLAEGHRLDIIDVFTPTYNHLMNLTHCIVALAQNPHFAISNPRFAREAMDIRDSMMSIQRFDFIEVDYDPIMATLPAMVDNIRPILNEIAPTIANNL